uniref:separase n=1 Tax=Mesocestoides corti TaxID=53468 RepID=A0A5K3FHR4_MESCO
HSAESAAWQAIESLSRQSNRVIDEAYGLVNRAFLKLRIAEQTCFADPEELARKIGRIQSALKAKSPLFSAYEELVLTVKLPTPHAHLQCIIVDALRAYFENYTNWHAINSRLDLVLMRHKAFLDSKVWAAVYSRGFINWLRLRARCSTGAPPEAVATEPSATPPVSPLFASISVRMHGRTLVKFMLTQCEQKLEQCGDKENLRPRGDGGETTHSTVWADKHLPDADLVNLWLATRLLLNGTFIVSELYTLLGTVKEARVYQLELLRIAQRFHIPSCAQAAICMMAYTDLHCQRKWAFDLRLTQLNHILHSKVPLQEIIRYRDKAHSDNKASLETAEESEFIKEQKPRGRRHLGDEDADGDEEDDGNYSGMATNPVVSAAAGGVAGLFPTSPVKTNVTMTSHNGFPSIEAMVSVISGRGNNAINAQEGFFTPNSCAHRILNGCLWAWLVEMADLVRTKVMGQDHYLSALVPPSPADQAPDSPENLSTAVERKCTLTPRVNPSTKAGRAATKMAQLAPASPPTDRRVAASEFRVPPNAPRRPVSGWANDEVLPRRSRRRAVVERDTSAPVDARKVSTASSGLKVTCGGKKSTQSRSGYQSNDEVDRIGSLARSVSATNSLFGYVGPSASGYTFGLEGRAPLQIHHDADPPTMPPPPRLRLFKDPEPPKMRQRQPKVSANNHEDSGDEEEVEADEEAEDATESCPAAQRRAFRPRNVRMAHKWASQHRSHVSPSHLPPLCPSEEVLKAQDALADRLYSVYSSLAGLPIPHLLRPVCQWLGLRWLGRGSHDQAARFFGQAVGLAASSLYSSILSSKLKDDVTPKVLLSVYSVAAPNDSSKYLADVATDFSVTIIQLMLVDELGQLRRPDAPTDDSARPSHDLVAGGLGARRQVYLIATRWVIGGPAAGFHSRVIHNFSYSGLDYLEAFDEIQTANADSMQEEDRRRFWSLRFSLDHRLKTLVKEMRTNWFTEDDINWIQGQDIPKASSELERPTILVLDRRLAYLPWEWLIWGQSEDEAATTSTVPSVCRSFSLSLVIGQLTYAASCTKEFDPRSAFYVLNPEANLEHTEKTFRDYIQQNFPTWNGVIGQMPPARDVVSGFTQHDLFVYLGHGNGSKYLMSTFDEGLNAKAVALIIGCSSGRPRLEGRHEAYASIFNHLIAGSPTAVSLLWDVTDRDIDRFTQSFLSRWLVESKDNDPASLCLTGQIFRATSACKLPSLVGKSVVVYGLPAIPCRR